MPTEQLVLRPEVAAFAQLMESQLRTPDPTRGPTGWKTADPTALHPHLLEEIDEFEREFAERTGSVPVLASEAADIANMLMMIVDVLGGLPALAPPTPAPTGQPFWLDLEALIVPLQAENATERRCRELSLAITHLEEASHWLDALATRRAEEAH